MMIKKTEGSMTGRMGSRYNNRTEKDTENYSRYSRYVQEDSERRQVNIYAGSGFRKRSPLRMTLISLAAVLGTLVVVCLVLRFVFPGFFLKEADRITRLLQGKKQVEEEETDRIWGGFIYESQTEAAGENSEGADAGSTISFTPAATAATMPSGLIAQTDIEVNGSILEDQGAYSPWYHMDFGYPESYTDVEGVITFRGDNFRSDPTYGTANLSENLIDSLWYHTTGGLTYGSATWTGSGWTGQPLIVKWPAQVKAAMNMHDWAKEKEDLVEVIYACMDGYVYFLDLVTGEETREPLYLGWTFKGAGALDPRGYPIMYLGAGYDSGKGTSRVFILNLLDCSVMYEFGNNDPFSLRGSLSYFDSSPLVDAASDTLIYPGESGILYLIHLNSKYDAAAGTVSIDPDQVVKWRYTGTRTSGASYWVGMETSAAIYEGYMFIADNGGNLMCMDLNTLQLVWVADILDDSNSTPVLSVEDGHLYLYVSTSFHYGWRSYNTATVPIWKIDAENGETVWQHDYECYTQEGVSGGVQSTIALGKHSLENYIYVTVSRTGGYEQGVLACIDKKTGELKWDHGTIYAWSSPACVYDDDGNGKVVYCTGGGKMFLLDGLTGGIYDSFVLSEGVIEASPAVYNNYVVVGTRACRIWGLELK